LTPTQNQIASIQQLRTQPTSPGATDIEAMNNRIIAIEWLYRLSGRTNGSYTGLHQAFQKLIGG
jgi:hypothetical protein